MPEEPSRPIEPLDADTAERLLAGRLDPDDAPPGYAEVARLLATAAAPADPSELTGEAAAIAAFRMARRPPQPLGRPARPTARRGRVRSRLAALALAGAVAVAGLGVWTAGGAPGSRELRSPSVGPSTGGSGSGTPASAAYGPRAGGAGPLRPSWPGVRPATATAAVTDRRPPSLPTPRERATARHHGGPTSRGGPPNGTKPGPPEQAKPKPPNPMPPKAQNLMPPKAQDPMPPKAQDPMPPKAQDPMPPAQDPMPPKAQKSNGEGPKATPPKASRSSARS